jgi:hypothetical protein
MFAFEKANKTDSWVWWLKPEERVLHKFRNKEKEIIISTTDDQLLK